MFCLCRRNLLWKAQSVRIAATNCRKAGYSVSFVNKKSPETISDSSITSIKAEAGTNNGKFKDLEAKAEDLEAKLENKEAKLENKEAKTEDKEAKVEDKKPKTENKEVKEVKVENKEAKTEDKVEDTKSKAETKKNEAKTEDNKVKIEAKVKDNKVKIEDKKAKGEDNKVQPEDKKAKSGHVNSSSLHIEKRKLYCEAHNIPLWPNIDTIKETLPLTDKLWETFEEPAQDAPDAQQAQPKSYTIQGRVRNIKQFSKNLAFYEIACNGVYRQVMLNRARLRDPLMFDKTSNMIIAGDHVEFTGYLIKSTQNKVNLCATDSPTLLSACEKIVTKKYEAFALDADRYVELLHDTKPRSAVYARHTLLQTIRQNFIKRDYIEVETPILYNEAGGAIARPFSTNSFAQRIGQFYLRCAPELFLKRLVVADFPRVFELGKVFRNESKDKSHNPEFTILEAYEAYASLDDVRKNLETLLADVAEALNIENKSLFKSGEYETVDYMAELQTLAGGNLPILTDNVQTSKELVELLQNAGHDAHISDSILTTLDQIERLIIEPKISSFGKKLVYLTNFPALTSPLAKSKNVSGHNVAQRFELYYNGQEIANAYQEENSPYEQDAKFGVQLVKKAKRNPFRVSTAANDSFVEALRWSLPPTTGLGIGIDRLLMAMLDIPDISQVLAFGLSKGQKMPLNPKHPQQLSEEEKAKQLKRNKHIEMVRKKEIQPNQSSHQPKTDGQSGQQVKIEAQSSQNKNGHTDQTGRKHYHYNNKKKNKQQAQSGTVKNNNQAQTADKQVESDIPTSANKIQHKIMKSQPINEKSQGTDAESSIKIVVDGKKLKKAYDELRYKTYPEILSNTSTKVWIPFEYDAYSNRKEHTLAKTLTAKDLANSKKKA